MDFQPEKESWQSYAERLDHYFTANKVLEDDQKVSTLILENDPSVYTLLKELSFPIDPKQLTYNDVMATLERHFVGVKNIFNERKVFYRAYMQPSETASEWHRRLKSLAINCEFGVFLDDILVDKFVCGFKGKVFQRLCEEGTDLNLLDAVKIAQLHEKVLDVTNKPTEKQIKNLQQQPTTQHQLQKQQQQPTAQNQHQKQQQQQQQHQKLQQQKQQFGHKQNNHQEFVKTENQHPNQRPAFSQTQRSHSQTRRLQQQSGQKETNQRMQQPKASQIFQQQQQPKSQHYNQQKQTHYHIVTQAPKKVPITCNSCGKVGHHENVCRNKSECCLS